MICHPSERDLIVAGATRLVALGDLIHVDKHGQRYGDLIAEALSTVVHDEWVAPQRWVDATGPCSICSTWGGWDHGDGWVKCPDCIDGRKREALQVECECEKWDWWEPADPGKVIPCSQCADTGSVTFAYATVEVQPGDDPEHWVVLLDNVELA